MMPGRRRDALIMAALGALILVIYWQTAAYEFVRYDDPGYITDNPAIRNGLTAESLRWAFTSTYFYNWHPLTWVSYMLDYALYGLNPRGYHLTNVGLHLANTLLVFLIFTRMTGAVWPSALVAAFFGVHPLHVESVAWISERKDVLSTLFWLLTMWTYTLYAQRGATRWYAATICLFALGLTAKPMLVTLPFVLLLLDYWPLRRIEPGLDRTTQKRAVALVVEKTPFFLLSAVSCVLTFYAQSAGGAVSTLEHIPFGSRVLNAVVSYAGYLGKMVWPVGLSVRYPHPGTTLSLWIVILSALVLTGITAAAIRVARSHPYALAGWLWYVGTLVPVIGVVQVGDQAMADRYTYIPLIGACIVIAWGVSEWVANWRPARLAASWLAVTVVVILTCLSWNQTAYWKDSVTLFERAASVIDGDPLLHFMLGNELRERGRLPEAGRHYQDALRFDPNFVAAHTNLGPILAQQGRAHDALTHYMAALRIRPDLAQVHNNLGMLLADEGRLAEALPHFEEAVRLKPDMDEAQRNLEIARRISRDIPP